MRANLRAAGDTVERDENNGIRPTIPGCDIYSAQFLDCRDRAFFSLSDAPSCEPRRVNPPRPGLACRVFAVSGGRLNSTPGRSKNFSRSFAPLDWPGF